jgi:hypothetical protein
MKSRTMLRTGAGVLFTALAIAAQPAAKGQTYATFDPPASQGTSPVSINPAGQIVGSYSDSNFATHGFVRATDACSTASSGRPELATLCGCFPGKFPRRAASQGSKSCPGR